MRTAFTRQTIVPVLLACGALLMGSLRHASGATPADDTLDSQAPQKKGKFGPGGGGVYKAQITPHWFANNARFWYRNNLRGGAKEFILVDAERGTRQAAFDHQKLADALSKASGTPYRADRLPFDSIEFVDDGKAVQFSAGGSTWKCDLTSYECSKALASRFLPDGVAGWHPFVAEFARIREGVRILANSATNSRHPAPDFAEAPWVGEQDPGAELDEAPQKPRKPTPNQDRPSDRSPDGKWIAVIKDHNVYLRARDNGQEVQLSRDGKEGYAYGLPQWAPDSKTLVTFRIEPGERKEVYLIESSPAGGGRAKLRTRPYALPGDKFTAYELNLFEVAGRRQVKPEVEQIDFGTPRLRWKRDGRHFSYQKVERGHQRFRVIEVDSHSGKSRNLIDERSRTFIWTAHAESLGLRPVNWLERTEEVLYVSEQDGWRHLYLIDAEEGKVKNQITTGAWVVRGIDRIDEENRQVWFRASGKNPDQDPYVIHFYRVNFDGTGLVALTETHGNHTVQYSPDRKYLLDTYSRVDLAPVHELRRVADGKLVCKLEEADITELKAGGWEPPEVFVAKGRDGTTDIWGIICRPRNFDPLRKYPVIEQIYAGPQGSFVPKTFSSIRRFASLTDLGFIVVQMDGMGTANRSKAFHDVCWHNLKDAGFPDRILWHQAAAKKYPAYDLSRVGIYGGSAGGQNATAGVLFHPEFYKVAVSSCGCHDNRMDKASWNEQWMGYPVGPQYSASSNIDNAQRLRGKLLLIVGELDTNVPPESTLRLADALIRAGKDFDLVVVPNAGHGNGGTYGDRRRHDFFVRHLHGIEPPNRNAAAPRGGE